jgi:hypothetical protein
LDFADPQKQVGAKGGGGGGMIAANNLLRDFVESLKGKNYSEVIILADHEATEAYRNALRSCHKPHFDSSGWCLYSKTLTEMIYFLRNEVKLKQPDNDTNNLFRSIQTGIDQENQKLIRINKTKYNIHKTASNG